MTNGTSQKANISPFVSGQSRMLDSVISQLSDMDGLAATKRRDLKSALNSMARTFVASPAAGGRVEFVTSGDFQARDESYLGDCHHLRPEGHAALARLLAPAVIRALEATEAGK